MDLRGWIGDLMERWTEGSVGVIIVGPREAGFLCFWKGFLDRRDCLGNMEIR